MNWPEAFFGTVCVIAAAPCVWVWWFKKQIASAMHEFLKFDEKIIGAKGRNK